jgi:hypothetical protein
MKIKLLSKKTVSSSSSSEIPEKWIKNANAAVLLTCECLTVFIEGFKGLQDGWPAGFIQPKQPNKIRLGWHFSDDRLTDNPPEGLVFKHFTKPKSKSIFFQFQVLLEKSEKFQYMFDFGAALRDYIELYGFEGEDNESTID